jgi:hypothetical protein
MINPVSRIVGLIIRPKKTFEEAKDDSLAFVFPLCILIIFLDLMVKLIVPNGYPWVNPLYTYDSVFTFLTSVAGALAGIGMLAIIMRIARKKQTLRPAARVFLNAFIPLALFQLLLAGITHSLAFRRFPLDGIYPAMGILTPVMWIWTIVLMAIGLKVIFGLPIVHAAVCSVAAFFAYYLLFLAMILPVTWILSTSETFLIYKLQMIPVVLVLVFTWYYIMEKRQLVQEQQNRWQDTQKYAWGAIMVLIASFLFLPLYTHGGSTDMSQLSAHLDMIGKSMINTPGNLYIQETELIAIIGLMIVLFFIHGIGIAGRRIPLLASILSFAYLWISGSIIAGWQKFFEVMDSRSVQAGWGTWIPPIIGLIYILIVVFMKETKSTQDATERV